jgi:hypothetical protein
MSMMHMPGFTATASLYKKGDFSVSTGTVLENVSERVQPAMMMNCADIHNYWQAAVHRGDTAWMAFWGGVGDALGC